MKKPQNSLSVKSFNQKPPKSEKKSKIKSFEEICFSPDKSKIKDIKINLYTL